MADAYKRLKKESPASKVSQAEFEWAMSVVQSRVFSGQLDPKLKSRLLPKVNSLVASSSFHTSAFPRWMP